MNEEVVRPLVNIAQKKQLESLAQLVQEEKERRLTEQTRKKSCVQPRKKVWEKRT
jgi:hypothetical protein